MAKLHQILAVGKNVRASAERTLTDGYHAVQKPAPLLGLSRTYRPLADEDKERLPAESVKVQTTVPEIIGVVRDALTRLFDITAAQEWTNCVARADVVVDGEVLVRNAPVAYLLFLERKLVELRKFIATLPTLDPSEDWVFDSGNGYYRVREPVITNRTKKVPRNHVKAEATDKHQAQVDMYFEDVVVGHWTKMSYSGMLPPTRQRALLTRVEQLQEAVKMARQAANDTEVIEAAPGAAFFGFLFGAD